MRQQLNISTISEIQSNSFNNTGSKIREPLTVQVDREEWSKCSISGSVGDRQSHRGRSASLTRRNKSPLRYSKPQYNRLSPDGSPSSRSGSGSAVSKERGRRRDKGSSTASLTPRSNSSSQYSSISSCTRNRAPSYDDRWRDSSPSRSVCLSCYN